MSSTPDIPGEEAALADLRKKIDELAAKSEQELVSPVPGDLADEEPAPAPTDAVGTEQWDRDTADGTDD